MLKIDGEEFDKAMEYELTKDEEYLKLISQIKGLLNQHIATDDSLINSLIVRIFELGYLRGFKDGMTFIIKREEANLFCQN